MEPLSTALLTYGPLGIVALAAMWMTVRLYRDLQAERARGEKVLADERAANTAAMAALQDRYLKAADTYATKLTEFSEAQGEVLASLGRRAERRERERKP